MAWFDEFQKATPERQKEMLAERDREKSREVLDAAADRARDEGDPVGEEKFRRAAERYEPGAPARDTLIDLDRPPFAADLVVDHPPHLDEV